MLIFNLQWKLLTVITDNINQMTLIRTSHLQQVKRDLGQVNLGKFDHDNQMIILSVITISVFHCYRTIENNPTSSFSTFFNI